MGRIPTGVEAQLTFEASDGEVTRHGARMDARVSSRAQLALWFYMQMMGPRGTQLPTPSRSELRSDPAGGGFFGSFNSLSSDLSEDPTPHFDERGEWIEELQKPLGIAFIEEAPRPPVLTPNPVTLHVPPV